MYSKKNEEYLFNDNYQQQKKRSKSRCLKRETYKTLI